MKPNGKKKNLIVLFTCLFVTMIGLGISLPVLPFYTERLALAAGASRNIVAIHVTLLSSIYTLMQFIFSPLWGRWSDRVGRRRLVLFGVAGTAATQVLFGLSTSLGLLYAARLAGGILSSAPLVAAAAYVADQTTEEERSRVMAWLGTVISLGVVAGLALGGLTARRDLHFIGQYGHFRVDSFSVPFFIAAFLMIVILFVALRWLPESLPASSTRSDTGKALDWRGLAARLRQLLGLAVAGQFGLTLFEATFALYAQERLHYGPSQVGAAFMVCGVVMAVFQAIAVGALSKRVSEFTQIALGFALMSLGITLLMVFRPMPLVLSAVGVLALGMAFITPNLSALISKRGGKNTGMALGLQNGATSLGQVVGPLFGGILFGWRMEAPYILSGVFLMSLAILILWKE